MKKNNQSWFRDIPHRWAEASLPLAYAVACVEVVAKKSKKAGAIYKQIVEIWLNPGLNNISKAIISELPESDIEKVKNALIHPEKEFLPDPNRPYKQIEKIFVDMAIDGDLIFDNTLGILSDENDEDFDKLARLVNLIFEFIIYGFNRESDIEKGRCRVMPSEKQPWLILAVMIRTSFESHNITLERLRRIYKLRKYKGGVNKFLSPQGAPVIADLVYNTL